ADELRRQLLVFDDRLGGAVSPRVRKEPTPGSPPRALQIDDGDLAIGRRHTTAISTRRGNHFAAPKRVFRLSRPVLNSVLTMALTTMSGWSFGRNCARQITEHPEPLGFASSTPV